jgi:hypothetical protein
MSNAMFIPVRMLYVVSGTLLAASLRGDGGAPSAAQMELLRALNTRLATGTRGRESMSGME